MSEGPKSSEAREAREGPETPRAVDMRDPLDTVTDEDALEMARRASMVPSSAPPPAPVSDNEVEIEIISERYADARPFQTTRKNG
jgi:hypothetical protein